MKQKERFNLMAGLKRKESEKYLMCSIFKNQIDSEGQNKNIK